MLLPDGEGTKPPEDGDGVLGLFLLPNSLLPGNLAISLLPLLPLACLLKLSTYRHHRQVWVLNYAAPSCSTGLCASTDLEIALMPSQGFQMGRRWRAIFTNCKTAGWSRLQAKSALVLLVQKPCSKNKCSTAQGRKIYLRCRCQRFVPTVNWVCASLQTTCFSDQPPAVHGMRVRGSQEGAVMK